MISSCPPHCHTCRSEGGHMQSDTPTPPQRHKRKQAVPQNGSWLTPYPKWHFNILPSPDFHFFIIASNLIEIFFRYGEEPTCKRRSPVDGTNFLWVFKRCTRISMWFETRLAYLMGYVSSFRLCFSWSGRLSQPKERPQSKLPRLWFWPYGEGFINSKVLRSIVDMSGLTTAV